MRRLFWIAVLLLALTATTRAGSLGYDPKADPFVQYQAAIEEARATHKLVLVVAGGDWCSWCHRLHRFIETNRDVNAKIDAAFVVVQVYVGEENSNSFFFDQLPRAYGAPHFWVVAPDRNVLSSQSTAPFENGRRGYDKQRFLAFVQRWDDVRATTQFAGMRAAIEP